MPGLFSKHEVMRQPIRLNKPQALIPSALVASKHTDNANTKRNTNQNSNTNGSVSLPRFGGQVNAFTFRDQS
jgi:hypothetical protein